jgi:hypothetical protein
MTIPIGFDKLDYGGLTIGIVLQRLKLVIILFFVPFSLNIYNSLNLNYYQAEIVLWHLNSKLFMC